jgi:hypothetical protein
MYLSASSLFLIRELNANFDVHYRYVLNYVVSMKENLLNERIFAINFDFTYLLFN